jgi:hypothetical protein
MGVYILHRLRLLLWILWSPIQPPSWPIWSFHKSGCRPLFVFLSVTTFQCRELKASSRGCVGKALPPPSLQCFQVMCADDIELSLMVLRVPHLSPTFEWKSIILSLYCLALPRHRRRWFSRLPGQWKDGNLGSIMVPWCFKHPQVLFLW